MSIAKEKKTILKLIYHTWKYQNNSIFALDLQRINYKMINIYIYDVPLRQITKNHILKHKNESRTIKLLINKIE